MIGWMLIAKIHLALSSLNSSQLPPDIYQTLSVQKKYRADGRKTSSSVYSASEFTFRNLSHFNCTKHVRSLPYLFSLNNSFVALRLWVLSCGCFRNRRTLLWLSPQATTINARIWSVLMRMSYEKLDSIVVLVSIQGPFSCWGPLRVDGFLLRVIVDVQGSANAEKNAHCFQHTFRGKTLRSANAASVRPMPKLLFSLFFELFTDSYIKHTLIWPS